MENIQQIINALIDEKAKENNTINLNAYAIGALDALEKSKYTEMLEMLQELVRSADDMFNNGEPSETYYQLINKAEKLIKNPQNYETTHCNNKT